MPTIEQNLQRLINATSNIANAITNKGGTVTQGDGLEEFASDIASIPSGVDTSNDTVTAATLKSGYTAHNAAGQQITGTMLSQPTTATAETIKEGFTAYNSDGELITGSASVSSWAELQQKVRNNDMDDISIGDQYACRRGNQVLVWDVIGKDIDTPADSNYTHSLTLRTHYAIENLAFDGAEAWYACNGSSLARYTQYYYRKYPGANADISRPDATIPKTGVIVSYNKAYENVESMKEISVTFIGQTSSPTGTNLGTLSYTSTTNHLNITGRDNLPSNNYAESAIRQWLNSNMSAGQWWTHQTLWDRPPAYADTANGFLYDLDPEFLSVIGKTQVITNKDIVAGADNNYITEDYFFLLSQTQVNLGDAITDKPEGSRYPIYSGNSSRISYNTQNSATSWILRTPATSMGTTMGGYTIRAVSTTGTLSYVAGGNGGIVIACNII